MNSYRKRLILKKLGSANVILVMIVNIALPMVSFLFVHLLLEYQNRHWKIEQFNTSYYGRVIFLSILLDIVVLAIIDVIFIIQPIIRLEQMMEEYQKLTKIEDSVAYDKYFTKSSLEKMFRDILKSQKQIQKRDKKAETLRQETVLYALQAQINPHFLYNTLDSIRGLALINDVEEIASMTEALSRLFRNMIAKEGKLLTLREEFENVNNYMTIQEFRFSNRFHYQCKISSSMLDRYMIPNLTLQPIVENAIMHGLERKRGVGTITISGYATEKRLILEVVDDGVGIEGDKLEELNRKLKSREIPADAKNQSGGIALININQRIKLRYGRIYGISIASTPDVSTTVELVLPLIRAEQDSEKGNDYD